MGEKCESIRLAFNHTTAKETNCNDIAIQRHHYTCQSSSGGDRGSIDHWICVVYSGSRDARALTKQDIHANDPPPRVAWKATVSWGQQPHNKACLSV